MDSFEELGLSIVNVSFNWCRSTGRITSPESFPLANILFPPAIFSLQNSKISGTDAHSGCFGSSHRRMALSIVLMAVIL